MSARRSIAFVLTLALAACGGGGPKPPPADPGDGGGGGGGGGGTAYDLAIDSSVEDQIAEVVDGAGSAQAAFAVQAVIAAAGFDTLLPDGTLLWEGDAPRAGIAFEQADPELIAAGLLEGPRVALDDLLLAWGAVVPSIPVATLRARFVADLRAAAQDPGKQTRRHWAMAVAQLGRTSPAPYDLFDPAVSGTSPLDPLQVALLTYRFQADLYRAGQAAKAEAPVPPALRAAAARPCTMTDSESTIMDAGALAGSTGFGFLIEEMGKVVPAAGKLAKFSGAANAALTVVKFLWTLGAFDGKVTASAAPLVRRYDGTYGGESVLTAAFRYDTGNAQAINCARPALNALGIDFSLPQDGPIAGARVDWEMFGVKERGGQTPIVRYKEGSLPLGRRTDDNGEDRVTLEGNKKSPALGGAVAPDFRLVPVLAKVALKDTKMWQDIQDAVGTALAGNPLSITLSLVSEMLLRMNTPVFAGRYGLVVEDHKKLDGVTLVLSSSGQRLGTVYADGTGSESAYGAVSFSAGPAAPDKAAIRWTVLNGQLLPGVLEMKENGHRFMAYGGTYTFDGKCLCVDDKEHIGDDAQWRGSVVADEEPRTVLAYLQPDGHYQLTYPIMPLAVQGKAKHVHTGCGDPPVNTTEPVGGIVRFQQLVIEGQLDPTKASGDIQGTWDGSLAMGIPARLGGMYDRFGVSQEYIIAQAHAEFVFSWTKETITVPGGATAPPPVEWAPRSLPPPTVRLLPAEPERSVRACFAPGPGAPTVD